MKRYDALFFTDEHADFVMGLAARIARNEPVFLWVSTSRTQEVWTKIMSAWKLGDSEPYWRRYGIMFDRGPRCQGWPTSDGAPSVRTMERP